MSEHWQKTVTLRIDSFFWVCLVVVASTSTAAWLRLILISKKLDRIIELLEVIAK